MATKLKSRYRSVAQQVPTEYEIINGSSKTVPDQVPTMRELLRRHSQGITDNISQNISFSGDLPDLRNYEPHELNAMMEKNRKEIKAIDQIKNDLAIKKKEAIQEARKEYDKKLLEKLKAEQQQISL